MNDHIREGELLRAVDGELSKDRAAKINEHLAACWMCRTRLNDFEGTIHRFVHVYINDLKSQIPEIDGPRALLRARIMSLESAEKRSWWEGLSLPLQWGRVSGYFAVALMAIAIISFPFIRLHRVAPEMTVPEVLNKAASGEQIGLRQATQRVTYQKLQIRVEGNIYNRSIYRDTRNARHVAKLQSIARPMSEQDVARMLDPVAHVFSEAKMDWEAPLSPSHLSGWRSALQVKADQVHRDEAITEVSTATPEGPIAEATVKFRNADYRPISETLRLRDNRVVEIAELDYGVLELNQVSADLFDAGSAPVLAVHAAGSEDSQANIGGVALELEVMRRLDRANALMGEQLFIERHRDSVHVRGVVDDKQRRDEIVMALGLAAKNPALQLDIAVPNGTVQGRKRIVHESVEGIEGFQRAPADGSLREFFAKKPITGTTTEEEVERFMDEVSLHSQSARAHALALKQIAERFSPDDLKAMTSEEHRQWRGMLQSHASAVLKETRLMRENLEPIFGANAEDNRSLISNFKSDADLVYAAAKLSDLTASNDSAVWHSFAASTQASNVTLVCLPEFWDSLLDAEILAEKISASTTDGGPQF
ncbi:hypothetical protein EDE15_1289 [Edaphobacter aggregans]|uniref:Uncharacterized protein n=1 Tax=Edaphobacter aggregans TaxID=570835 RepID=A0A428MFW2_9BACT|nr:hypothetical protein [Edaphobacter aggregans]RSL15786.1 hypothetical protein EDE15_1289 [Edaphobacter aggregans]